MANFLSLPRELRDTIYEYAFEGNLVEIFTQTHPHPQKVPGIALSCKTLSSESLEAYYKCSTFFHSIKWELQDNAVRWIINLPKIYRDRIRQVKCLQEVNDHQLPLPRDAVRKLRPIGRWHCMHWRDRLPAAGIEFKEDVFSAWEICASTWPRGFSVWDDWSKVSAALAASAQKTKRPKAKIGF